MRITRIGSDKTVNRPTQRIEISILNAQGTEMNYVLTQEHGTLKIHNKDDFITITPCCANEIYLG